MIVIDGSQGEGGGQVLRTSLALAACTGQPVRIENVRARREKPGLRPQHLAAVEAVATVAGADVSGAFVGSGTVELRPREITCGEHHFPIGTAGSVGLVVQAVLPALLCGGGRSRVVVEGGTHARMAPSFHFLARAFLPLVARMGPRIEARMERAGFFPKGGGRIVLDVEPCGTLSPLELLERGPVLGQRATAIVANLPDSIGRRELAVVAQRLGWGPDALRVEAVDALGSGNALVLEAQCEHVTEIVTGFGERGVAAETVAARACDEMARWLGSGAPVGEHLADQLLVPMALAGRGRFRTLPLTLHATTNAAVIERFLPVRIRVTETGPGGVEVDVDVPSPGPAARC